MHYIVTVLFINSRTINFTILARYKLDFLSTTCEPKEVIPQTDIDITATLRSHFENPKYSQNDVFSYIDVSECFNRTSWQFS